MVTLEVSMDAQGLVRGARDAVQSLNQASNSVQHMMGLLVNLNGAGAAGGAMGKFATAIGRWQPALLVATTAFSAINLALSAFRRTTDDATSSVEKFSAAWSQTFVKGEVGKIFGDPTSVLAAGRARMDQMQQVAESIFASGQPVTAGDLARMSGMNPQMVMQRWAQTSQPDLWRSMGGLQGSSFSEPEWAQASIRPREAAEILAIRQRELRAELPAASGMQWQEGSFGPGMPLFQSGFSMPEQWNGVRISEGDQFAVDEDNRIRAARQLQQEMADMEQRAQRIGDTLASGFLRAATGAATVQQIVGEMLLDIAQSALSSGFASVAQGFMGGFGATPAQRAG